MGFTTSAALGILKQQFSGVFVGLSTTAPTHNGGNFTEPGASTGYERAPIGDLNTAKSAQVANDAIIFFNESLADWGTVTHFGLFTAKGAATPFFTGELTEPVTVGTGYVPIFRAQELVVGLDKEVLESYD